jgi:hypothetical protein
MARRLHLSANQTAAVACIGGIVAASAYLIEFPMSAARAHGHHGAFWPWAVIMFTLLIGGGAIALLACLDLESGVAAQRWSDSDIDRLRALFNSRLFKALGIGLFIGAVALFIVPHTIPSMHNSPSGWSLYFLGLILLQLRNATRLKPESAERQPTWESLRPLQSSHWGER